MLSDNLFRKLGIQGGYRVLLIDPPSSINAALDEIAPPGVEFSRSEAEGGFDQILFWPQTLSGLPLKMMQLAPLIAPDGAVWLIIPKKKYAKTRGLPFTWNEMQSEALKSDLVDNKVVSFSDTDYGTKFVIRKQHRQKYEQ